METSDYIRATEKKKEMYVLKGTRTILLHF